MKIVINTSHLLSLATGVGKSTYYLAKALVELDDKNDYYYYYGYFSKKLYDPSNGLMQSSCEHLKTFLRLTPLGPLLKRLRRYLARLSPTEFDIYLEPNFILLDTIRAKKRFVIVHDFSFVLYPDWHPKDRIAYLKQHFFSSITLSDGILFPSQYIYNQALDMYQLDKSKLDVIYWGVDHNIFRSLPEEKVSLLTQKFNLPEKFILFVGSIEPRKNLKNLLLAYLMLPKALKEEYSLVMAGFKGWCNREIFEVINQGRDKVRYLGYVAEEDLALLYNRASLFVYPSFYEGFGLPPLEAMACGCPTVVSNVASLPEVCGDAVYYVTPSSPEDLKQGLVKVLEDRQLRENLSRKGLERAKMFTWEKTAQRLLEIFKGVG